MPIQLPGRDPSAHVILNLRQGEAFSAQTPGTGELRVGYARIVTSPEVSGTAVFTRIDAKTGVVLYEAGVPASRPMSNFAVLVDSLGTRDNGVALVNASQALQSSDGMAKAELTLFGTLMNQVGKKTLPLSRGEHLAKFAPEIFEEEASQAGDMQGMIFVDSDQPLAAVTLRQNEDPGRQFPDGMPTLTGFPVLPLGGYSDVFYFP